MHPKYVQFFTSCWFISFLICMILEGAFFGSHDSRNILNDLALFTTIDVGTIFSIPVFNVRFFYGLFRAVTWDYSFYSGYWQFLRWFWMAVLSPGLVFGLGQTFIWVYAQIISMFKFLTPLLGF